MHGNLTRVVVHELLEGLGEALGSELADVHGEDDEVEVPLDVVHDLGLEVGLPVVGGDVEGHLGLDDALTDVLDTGSTRGRGGEVDQLVDLENDHDLNSNWKISTTSFIITIL